MFTLRINRLYLPTFIRAETGMLLVTRHFMFATGSYRRFGRPTA